MNQLLDIYYASVGRNSNLLLNVPPDRRGKIHPNDSTRLMELKSALDQDFIHNLAKSASIKASSTRGKSRKFKADNLLDGNYDSFWATDDEVFTASITLGFKQNRTFNRIILQEYIPLGQRIAGFNLEYWDDSLKKWNLISAGTTIGYKRILRFPAVNCCRIRVNITKSHACPVLNNIEIYNAPESISMPIISRNKDGFVSILNKENEASVFYTTDGTEPGITSQKYTHGFSFLERGVIKAITISNNGLNSSEVNSIQFDIAPDKWNLLAPLTAEAIKAIDGIPHSIAYLKPQESLIIDFGENLFINELIYYPENSESASNILVYDLYLSVDGIKWELIEHHGSFDNIKNNPVLQRIKLNSTVKARFLKMDPVEFSSAGDLYSIGEVTVVTQ